MENFLNEIKGSNTDYPLFVEPSIRIQNVKNRIALINEQDLFNKRKAILLDNQPLLNLKALYEPQKKEKTKEKQKEKKYITRSILKIKSTPKCPEGYIRSLKTGKCIKDKRKPKQKINYDSVLNILKGLKV